MILIESDNYKVEFYGTSRKLPKKVHYNKTISTNGIENSTTVRPKMDYEINVVKMEQVDYDKLIKIFLYENSFSFIDKDKNHEGQQYEISGEQFSLDEVENKKHKSYQYKGVFNIEKI